MTERRFRGLGLEGLGLAPQQRDLLQRWLQEARGVILFTGQREAGVTTSHYACVRHLLDQGRRVSSAEAPIEEPLPLVVQHEVDPVRGYGMAQAARAALEAPASASLVGLVPDAETAGLVASAADSRLVLTLLWDVDVLSAAARFRELSQGVPRAGPLLGVVLQERGAGATPSFRLHEPSS